VGREILKRPAEVRVSLSAVIMITGSLIGHSPNFRVRGPALPQWKVVQIRVPLFDRGHINVPRHLAKTEKVRR
jgi:hypothetical protein